VGNAKQDRIPDMLRFFSTHIVDGFDPTVGLHAVVAQLEVLNIQDLSPPEPDNVEDLHRFIQEKLDAASKRDDDTFGFARDPTATLVDALPVFERCSRRCVISANYLTCSKLKFNTLSIDAVDHLRPPSSDNIQFVCLRLNCDTTWARVSSKFAQRCCVQGVGQSCIHLARCTCRTPSDNSDVYPFTIDSQTDINMRHGIGEPNMADYTRTCLLSKPSASYTACCECLMMIMNKFSSASLLFVIFFVFLRS
jgi:hypothetical protein